MCQARVDRAGRRSIRRLPRLDRYQVLQGAGETTLCGSSASESTKPGGARSDPRIQSTNIRENVDTSARLNITLLTPRSPVLGEQVPFLRRIKKDMRVPNHDSLRRQHDITTHTNALQH